MAEVEPGYARFGRSAWGVLAYCLAVVLWGAYVRATGSGAGCGGHWPLCNGQVVPRAPKIETIIEFTHRVTSGLALVAAAVLVVWSVRLFPRGHRVRRGAALSLAFLFVEALLGAGLVLFHYVAQNASVARAIYLSAHLANTQLLLAALAMTAWFAGRPNQTAALRWPPAVLTAALPVALVVSITGVIAALGDTLYPPFSIAAGMRQEFSGAAHLLVRLRVLHPVLAVAAALYLLFAASSAIRLQASGLARRTALLAALLVFLQLAAGAVNVTLLAPVWMQILHLLIADLLWIAFVALALETAADAHNRPHRAVA